MALVEISAEAVKWLALELSQESDGVKRYSDPCDYLESTYNAVGKREQFKQQLLDLETSCLQVLANSKCAVLEDSPLSVVPDRPPTGARSGQEPFRCRLRLWQLCFQESGSIRGPLSSHQFSP
jgi:hypothetical protein